LVSFFNLLTPMVLIALMCPILALLGMIFHLLVAFASICGREALPGLDEKITGVFLTGEALGFCCLLPDMIDLIFSWVHILQC